MQSYSKQILTDDNNDDGSLHRYSYAGTDSGVRSPAVTLVEQVHVCKLLQQLRPRQLLPPTSCTYLHNNEDSSSIYGGTIGL